MTICDGVTIFLGAGAVSKIPSLSSHTVTDKVFAGCRELFQKAALSRLPARSVRSMSAAGTRSPPRRAQNLLAGCIFVGIADKSAFALLSGK